MTENNKSHLWITDGEVQNIENKPTARSKDLGRDAYCSWYKIIQWA